MSRKLAVFVLLLVISSTACALTSSAAPQPTPVVLQPTLLPSLTPTPITPTPSPTATTASSGNGSTVNTSNNTCTPRTDWPTYIVVQGNTLGQIAERTGTTAQQLATANCLSNADIISAGQPLRVPRQPIPPTITPRPGSIDLNPTGNPPGNVCVVSNPNPSAPVQVYVDGNNNTLVPSNYRLVTWAPYVGVRDAWYQISIPNTGANWIPASQVVVSGVTCPQNNQICLFTYVGSGRFVAHSGAGSNYPYSVELPGNTPLPVLARSDGWVQVGTDYTSSGWIESTSGTMAGSCESVWYIPLKDFQVCLLTMSQPVQVFAEPSFDAQVVMSLQPDQQIEADAVTITGWYSYRPSADERYWIPAGLNGYSHISRSIGCDALNVVAS